jgi:hypothetical protein
VSSTPANVGIASNIDVVTKNCSAVSNSAGSHKILKIVMKWTKKYPTLAPNALNTGNPIIPPEPAQRILTHDGRAEQVGAGRRSRLKHESCNPGAAL